ncbi:MAG: GIY-YIG nuclease family protein [Elusimicrobiaceae bacterium]|nr:GIY-YIG nuclease family protein [Elusimicrobiaceae bacterium]
MLTNRTNDVLYIGVTNDLTRRIYEHKTHTFPGFTRNYNIVKLVYVESCNNIVDAIRREKQLKAWRRTWKRELITSQNPRWQDLAPDIP